ncbi:MAG: hypothetical protein QXR87_02475 [Candidatus Hadarchaeales archaeon]
MGVFHLCGLGINPGALTVPLTYIYTLLKAASKGDPEAQRFFESSGEAGQKLKGAPEYIIVFTSEDVISGKARAKEVRDNWFHNKDTSVRVVGSYLSDLWKKLRFQPFYDGEWVKGIYLVKVRHDNFDDCFQKIGTTFYALRDKEIWVNLTGGTNQINFALLLGGCFTATAASYYYVFQQDTSLLHPEGLELREIEEKRTVDEILRRWNELPLFQLQIGETLMKLQERFAEREILNRSEVVKILGGEEMLPKFRRFLSFEEDKVRRGILFEKVVSLMDKIDRKVDNFSKWLDWAKGEGILSEL